MKKKILLFLSLATIILGIAACNNSQSNVAAPQGNVAAPQSNTSSQSFNPSTIKTMGDFLAYKDEENYNCQEATTENYYIVVLKLDGTYYRAIADLPKDLFNEMFYSDNAGDKESEIQEKLSALPVSKIENLSEQMPKQEELDKYIGKTGQDLYDEGWNYFYYNLEDMEAGMDHDLFSYTVKFDYDGPPMVNTDDFDFFEKFKDIKIKSITCDGIGDATYMGE